VITPHKFLSVFITLLVLSLLFTTILPANAQTSTQSVPTGLGDYERWFGSQHSHINMGGDDGATGSPAAHLYLRYWRRQAF